MLPKQKSLLLAVAIVTVLCTSTELFAQTKSPSKSSSCNTDSALDMIRQQVALTRTFNESPKRITVLLRAGTVLWAYDQSKARSAFSEAFELASNLEIDNEKKAPSSLILRLQVDDQRYVVIRAVARKDPAWAKKLTEQMLSSEKDQNNQKRGSVESILTAERLLGLAITLIKEDLTASLDLARISLRYPASSTLTRFLYQLAEVNQSAADEFYGQALAAYADRPMSEFLYLQAYPFGWREILNTPVFSFYQVPTKLVPNKLLQQQLLQAMLRRAQPAPDAPKSAGLYQRPEGEWLSEEAHLLEGLITLEPQVRELFPELLPALIEAREKILVSLPLETQKLLLKPGREIATEPDTSFDDLLESAQKVADPNERNEAIANTVMSGSGRKENLDHLVAAVEAISDSNLRGALFEWLYFQRASEALSKKETDFAERLLRKVDGLEQRAYLHVELARVLVKKSDSMTHAREVLDEGIAEAKRAGATLFTVRSLLAASNLYAELEPNIAISVLGDAITFTNRLDSPDFLSDGQALEKRLARHPRKNRGHFIFRFYMPGLDPEGAFLEMAKLDFDSSLVLTNSLTDKFQRALSSIAVADACLQNTDQRPKGKRKTRS